MRVEKTENQTAYGLLSRYRSALMGVATLWVMLFHAYPFEFGVLPLDAFKAVGFCGVDLFILLSGMGLSVSLQRRAGQERLGAYYRRRLSRILPAYWLVVGVYSLWLRLQGRISLTVAAWSMSTLHYWFDIPNSFNWYVPAQLAFYLIAPFYVGRLVRCRHREVPTLLAFPVSFALCRLSGILGVSYLTDFLYRIPAFAIGCLLGCYLLEGRELTARHRVMWGCRLRGGAGDPAADGDHLHLLLLRDHRPRRAGVPAALQGAGEAALERAGAVFAPAGHQQPGDLSAECGGDPGIRHAGAPAGPGAPPSLLLRRGIHAEHSAGAAAAPGDRGGPLPLGEARGCLTPRARGPADTERKHNGRNYPTHC